MSSSSHISDGRCGPFPDVTTNLNEGPAWALMPVKRPKLKGRFRPSMSRLEEGY